MKRRRSIEDFEALQSRIMTDHDDAVPTIVIPAGTCCQASGANDLIRVAKRELLDKKLTDTVRLRITGCQGFCQMEPSVLVEPRGTFYPKVGMKTMARIVESVARDEILADELFITPDTGEQIERQEDIPFFRNQVRTILSRNEKIDPLFVYDYIINQGYSTLAKVFKMADPDWVINEVKVAGLRGRGGAGFPTGLKWEFLANQANGHGKFLVCNADEGDPGAYMDRSVIEGNPHGVIEGMIIGAYATGSTGGVIYVRNEYPLAIKHLIIALRQAREVGLLGENILGTGFSFDINLVKGAGAFVCGEETALIRSIEGKMGEPRQRPPFPVQKGIEGKPTAINNVETWANIPIIIEKGAHEFAKIGTENNSGTKIFSLVGKAKYTGLVEVPMGTTIKRIVYEIGGGPIDNARIKAVQTGGPSGGCIPAELFDIPVDYDSLSKAGSIMGSGGMIVMDDNTCMVDIAKYFMNFLKDESCGKCFTCRKGTQRMYEILDDISQGHGTLEQLQLLEELAGVVKDTTMCGLGQTASNPVLSTLRYFREEYLEHILEKHCSAVVCSGLYKAPCQHACPVEMDIPSYVALIRAGRLDDAYKVLIKTNPFPSVCGRVCDKKCEYKCSRAMLDGPVHIKYLKRFVTDNATRPMVEKVPVTRKEKIAVIGAGPSGMTAARDLALKGFHVTVFEAFEEAGGMLRWGIPDYRLPREILNVEIRDILAQGVELRCETKVGEDVSWDQIKEEFDAIYMAIGASSNMRLGVEGEDLKGVSGAIQFLRDVNLGQKLQVGKHVAVIGGGNSAIDAARSAVRLGAEKVSILYRRTRPEMPAQEEEILAAEEEGVKIQCLVSPIRFQGKNGHVQKIICQKMALGDFDASGRRKPVPSLGNYLTSDAHEVIVAIGQQLALPFPAQSRDVKVSKKGFIEIRAKARTRVSEELIFAGGDAVRGPDTVIGAIAAGRWAAKEIDAAIRKRNQEPAYMEMPGEEIEIPRVIDEQIREKSRASMHQTPVAERIKDFREVEMGFSQEVAMEEACRCLRCDISNEET